MNRRHFLAAAGSGLLLAPGLARATSPPAPEPVAALPPVRRAHRGYFTGKLELAPNDDGRTMRLLQPYGYVDPRGLWWSVPEGIDVDGASIPPWLWSFIGGPFEGKYRNASVIHDYFCDVRLRRSDAVHRMFHEAMLTGNVPPFDAWKMYEAVHRFGPQWNDQTVHNSIVRFGPPPTVGPGPGPG